MESVVVAAIDFNTLTAVPCLNRVILGRKVEGS